MKIKNMSSAKIKVVEVLKETVLDAGEEVVLDVPPQAYKLNQRQHLNPSFLFLKPNLALNLPFPCGYHIPKRLPKMAEVQIGE